MSIVAETTIFQVKTKSSLLPEGAGQQRPVASGGRPAHFTRPADCQPFGPGLCISSFWQSPTCRSALKKRRPICQPFALLLLPSPPHDKLPTPSGLRSHASDRRMGIHGRPGRVPPRRPSWALEDVLNQNHIPGLAEVLAQTLAGHYGNEFQNLEGRAGNKRSSYLLCFL